MQFIMSSRRPFRHSLIYFAAAAAVLLITPATATTGPIHANCLMQVEPWHPQNTPHVLLPTQKPYFWTGFDSVSAQIMVNGYLAWKGDKWLYGSADAPIAYVKEPEGVSFDGSEPCFDDNSELIRISDNTHFGLLLQLEAPYLTTCPPMRGVPTAHEQRNVVTFEGITPNSLRDCVAHAATRVDVESIKSVVYHSETKLCSGIKYEDPTNRTLDSSSESSDLFCDFQIFGLPARPVDEGSVSAHSWIHLASNWSGTLEECADLVKRHYPSANTAWVDVDNCTAVFRAESLIVVYEGGQLIENHRVCIMMPRAPSPQVPFEECFMQTSSITPLDANNDTPPSLLIPMTGTTDRRWCVYDTELKRCTDLHLAFLVHQNGTEGWWTFRNQTSGVNYGRIFQSDTSLGCDMWTGNETCFGDSVIVQKECMVHPGKDSGKIGQLYRLSEPYYTSCPPSQGYVSWTHTAVITDFKDDSFFPTSLRDCVAYARAHYEPARFASVAFNKEEGLCNGSDQPPTPEETGVVVFLGDYCNFGCTPILGVPNFQGSGDLLPVSTSTEVPVPTGTVVRGSEACYMSALETYENVMGVMFEGDSCYGVPEFLGGLYDENASGSWCYNHEYKSVPTTTTPPPTTPPPTTPPPTTPPPPTTSPTSPTESDDVDYSSSAFMPMNNIKAATAVTTIAVAVAAVVA